MQDDPRQADPMTRRVALLEAHRQIEQQIYRMGYALENGDFELVGELLRHATPRLVPTAWAGRS